MNAQRIASVLRRFPSTLLCIALISSICPGQDAYIDLDSVDPLSTLLPRIEVTSRQNSTIYCAGDQDKFQSGYAHYTNNSGVEDKHMFWWLFEAHKDSESAPVVLVFGGGPGTTGLGNVFSGAGPCHVIAGEDGKGALGTSPYPWTTEVNILAIDHPIGVGFSYGDDSALRNNSAQAAWDVDDFLQAFWIKYPHLSKNQFLIQAGSYGGTFIPHIVSTIHDRNLESTRRHASNRNPKMPEAVMMSNVWSDPQTHFRWFVESNCNDNKFSNQSVCDDIIRATPACLDAIQLAYEQPTLKYRLEALTICNDMMEYGWMSKIDRNPCDVRIKCSGMEECFPQFRWFDRAVDQPRVRSAIGVPDFVNFTFLNMEKIGNPFEANGDSMQASYRLLAPAIDAGLRLLVYNGNKDGLCPWRSNLAWMKLLKTKHQVAFREAKEVAYPGVGYVQQVGSGSGDYTFLRITDAGHFVQDNQPELVRHILIRWLKNEPFF